MSRAWLLLAWLVAGSRCAFADGPGDLARRLQELNAAEPFAGTVELELRLARTLGRHSATAEAELRVGVDQDASGLHVHWDPATLRDADAEESNRDLDLDRLTPLRQAMAELDASRLSHLLDQRRTVAGLARGTFAGEKTEPLEGRAARRLEYTFRPRLSWTDAYFLRHGEGRLTLWVEADGTPLASESVASYEGKTSRVFGRFHGTTTVRTRYAVEGGRLRVAERQVEETVSREDGGEVQRTTRRFRIEPR